MPLFFSDKTFGLYTFGNREKFRIKLSHIILFIIKFFHVSTGKQSIFLIHYSVGFLRLRCTIL